MLSGKCATVYGPMASRRFGRSLGLNLGDPARKFCTWNCRYCQFGEANRTAPPRFPGPGEVIRLVEAALDHDGGIDCITLAGNSEPTLSPHFTDVVERLIALRQRRNAGWRLHCLTNGARLGRKEVRLACDRMDGVWVKLDCAEAALFERLNRPSASTRPLEEQYALISGLRRPGIQTLLWRHEDDHSLQNWTRSNVTSLLDAYSRISPREVQITTVARETPDPRTRPLLASELEGFREKIEKRGIAARVFA